MKFTGVKHRIPKTDLVRIYITFPTQPTPHHHKTQDLSLTNPLSISCLNTEGKYDKKKSKTICYALQRQDVSVMTCMGKLLDEEFKSMINILQPLINNVDRRQEEMEKVSN